jgi:hypothetical protein
MASTLVRCGVCLIEAGRFFFLFFFFFYNLGCCSLPFIVGGKEGANWRSAKSMLRSRRGEARGSPEV